MKLNLLLDNPGDVRSGYVNVDPFAPDNDPQRVKADVSDLSAVVDAGEATEVVALDILDYFPGPAADAILGNWLSRLAHGGKLTLSVVDLREVCRAVLSGSATPEDANELLLGRQEKPWQYKKSAYTLAQLVEVLTNLGYRVLAKRNQQYRAVVTVERP